MQHRGEIVEGAVRHSGYSITKLSFKLGKSRRWIYYAFENANMPIELIIEIGKIIHHDFSAEIKELKNYSTKIQDQTTNEPTKTYREQSKEIEIWKNKYLDILEKYNKLLTADSSKKKGTSKTKR